MKVITSPLKKAFSKCDCMMFPSSFLMAILDLMGHT
jgi:hypothetical protein